jgi:hypothetical protein
MIVNDTSRVMLQMSEYWLPAFLLSGGSMVPRYVLQLLYSEKSAPRTFPEQNNPECNLPEHKNPKSNYKLA